MQCRALNFVAVKQESIPCNIVLKILAMCARFQGIIFNYRTNHIVVQNTKLARPYLMPKEKWKDGVAMNFPEHSEGRQWRTPGRWGRLAWLPIPLLLAAIIAARIAGLRTAYESYSLLLVLSFTFYTMVSLGTLYLIGRNFLVSGLPGLLLLECGVVLWSLAGTVGDYASGGDANIDVTIFNIGILLAGVCHLTGAVFVQRQQRSLRAKPLWLVAGCALSLGALWMISQATLRGWLPVFFIPGHGGTLVRYFVLISAIAMFVLCAALLHASQSSKLLPFTSWYALALLLLAVGLFGVMIQLSIGSVVNWLSRIAQWLGGVYLLCAALASLREAQIPLIPQENKPHPAYYRDAIAAAIVIAAAAMRLTFLSILGTNAPYLLFYPAIMFAAIYGGLRAALLSTALSAILVDYFWIEPIGHLTINDPVDCLILVIFLLSGTMIAWVTNAMHSARARVSAAETQALLAVEREAAMEELLEGRAKLEAAMASMTDAVFISDTEGRFIDFNDAFATFHKFRNKDECAKTFAEYPTFLNVFMADGKQAPLDQWAVPRALRGESATNAEYTLRRKDTGETWVGSYSFAPILDKNGVIVGSVVAARDITAQKQAEEDIRQRTSLLEAANKELEAFTYSVSHDLRAPLRAIDGFVKMLARDVGNRLNNEEIRKFNVIADNARKMGQLIDDLLAFSRLGRQAISPSFFDMEDLVGQVWEECKAVNARSYMELKTGDLPQAFGDVGLMKQVLRIFYPMPSNSHRREKKLSSKSGAEKGKKKPCIT